MDGTFTFDLRRIDRLEPRDVARQCASDAGVVSGYVRVEATGGEWVVDVFPDAPDDSSVRGRSNIRYRVSAAGKARRL